MSASRCFSTSACPSRAASTVALLPCMSVGLGSKRLSDSSSCTVEECPKRLLPIRAVPPCSLGRAGSSTASSCCTTSRCPKRLPRISAVLPNK